MGRMRYALMLMSSLRRAFVAIHPSPLPGRNFYIHVFHGFRCGLSTFAPPVATIRRPSGTKTDSVEMWAITKALARGFGVHYDLLDTESRRSNANSPPM